MPLCTNDHAKRPVSVICDFLRGVNARAMYTPIYYICDQERKTIVLYHYYDYSHCCKINAKILDRIIILSLLLLWCVDGTQNTSKQAKTSMKFVIVANMYSNMKSQQMHMSLLCFYTCV